MAKFAVGDTVTNGRQQFTVVIADPDESGDIVARGERGYWVLHESMLTLVPDTITVTLDRAAAEYMARWGGSTDKSARVCDAIRQALNGLS